VRLFGLLLFVAGFLHAQANRASLNQGFDKPLKTTVADFGPSPFHKASKHVRNKLTCSYYPTFTVKEYDQGEKGAEWLSIARSGQAACTRTRPTGTDFSHGATACAGEVESCIKSFASMSRMTIRTKRGNRRRVQSCTMVGAES
jgi:hypothetical protein